MHVTMGYPKLDIPALNKALKQQTTNTSGDGVEIRTRSQQLLEYAIAQSKQAEEEMAHVRKQRLFVEEKISQMKDLQTAFLANEEDLNVLFQTHLKTIHDLRAAGVTLPVDDNTDTEIPVSE